jgi:uncharacterized membrane protein
VKLFFEKMPAKETTFLWEAFVKLMYGIVAVFVFSVLLAALGELAFRMGDITDKVGETGAAILLGMTAIALAILVGSILHSLRQQ